MGQQLTLGVSLRDDATFENFVSVGNKQVLHCLQEFIADQGERFIYLWGVEGVGRTHLLQACCHEIFNQGGSAMYLSLADKALRPDVLCNLESIDYIFIDDVDAVLNKSLWEESLLHFYNRLRDKGRRLIVAAASPPVQTACRLPDLRSRLSWGLLFQVKPISDEQKIEALQLRAHHRGLMLSDEVGKFLLRRYPRDMSALFSVLDILDQASLAAKRRLTIPFVKEALEKAF
jgi:DnaA family protein